MNQTQQTMLFLCRQAPYGSTRMTGALDMLLTAAAFDQKVILVFTAEGVFNLLREQQAEALGLKQTSKALSALELYGVSEVLVDADALSQQGLSEDELLLPVRQIDSSEIQRLISAADQVFIN